MPSNPGIALWLFHLRVGARLALRSSALLFCALLAAVMFDMYPAAVVQGLALGLFGARPDAGEQMMVACLALLLALWAAPRVTEGLRGWIRHLPASRATMRRAVAAALVVVEAPLALSLALLAGVARARAAAAVGATLAVWAVVLVAAACIAVPLREAGPRRRFRPAGELLALRIAWRALGRRLAGAYAAGLLPLGATALFLANNDLPRSLAAASVRLGATLSLSFFLSVAAAHLAARRPPWPWARSLPRSSARRIGTDAILLALHALPVALLACFFDARAAAAAVAALPLLVLRAAAHMRALGERRTGSAAFSLEGFALAASIALVPRLALAAAAAGAYPAFLAARDAERGQKVSRWRELHHRAFGDPLSWSGE